MTDELIIALLMLDFGQVWARYDFVQHVAQNLIRLLQHVAQNPGPWEQSCIQL